MPRVSSRPTLLSRPGPWCGGPGRTWGGVLSTAGGLVFYGDDSGALVALDAGTGKPLWNFHASVTWKASPMTYFINGRQYIAVAAGSQVMAFALAEESR